VRKHIKVKFILIAGAVIFYGLVLFTLGFPIVNGDITKGTSYADIAKASATTAVFYRIYICAWIVTMATVTIGIILICLQGWFQRYIISKNKAVVVVVIVQVFFWVCVLAIISSLTIVLSNFFIYRIADTEPLREFARAYSVRFIGSAILFGIFSFYLFREAMYFRLSNASRICSDHYLSAHFKAIDDEDIKGAEQAIEKACFICPTSVRAWSLRSHFANVNLSNQRDALIFLDRAEMILSRDKSVSNEDKACYEYFLGTYLLSREEYQKAVEHISKSLDLVYSRERAEYLEKIKRTVNEMVV
jgi:hypothetical protein